MLFTNRYDDHVKRCENAVKSFFQIVTQNQPSMSEMLLTALGGNYRLNNKLVAEKVEALKKEGKKIREFDILDHDILQPELETNYVIKLITESYNTTSAKFNEETQKIHASKDGNQIRDYWRNHETIIGVEFLVYLKIWEMDSFLRQLYQLSNIATGTRYDWFLEVSSSNYEMTPTLHKYKKHQIRETIKTNLEKAGATELLDIFNEGYMNHLRNAIAHSQYFFMNQKIDLVKYNKAIDFEQWLGVLYPLTLALYSAFSDEVQKVILPRYEKIATENNNAIPVILGNEEKVILHYDSTKSPGYRWRF